MSQYNGRRLLYYADPWITASIVYQGPLLQVAKGSQKSVHMSARAIERAGFR